MFKKIPVLFFVPLCLMLIVSCSKEDSPPATEKSIETFVLKNGDGTVIPTGNVSLTIGKDTISVQLPVGTDLTNLIPQITFKGVGLEPASGVRQNFTRPVKYTVTAGDGSKKEYTVVVQSRVIYFGGPQSFYALDEMTGNEVWKYSRLSADFSYSDPVLYNNVIYTGSVDGNVYAFNARTGAVIWQHQFADDFECGPAVAGNTVYIGNNDDNFYALDATTGQEKWRFPTYCNQSSNPVLFGNNVIFGSSEGDVYSLDTATGGLVWKYPTGHNINASGPRLSNGIVFIGSRSGSLYAINAATGQLKWEHATGVSLEMSTPSVYNGVVYISGWYDVPDFKIPGSVYAVNEYTGQRIATYLERLGFSSSPCVDNGKLYISADNSTVYAVDALSGKVFWQKEISPNGATPAVSATTVFVGGGGTGHFYALSRETGNERWKIRLSGLTVSTPVFGNW
jgi:outer membrane protein assembly factor BamB